MSSFGVPLTAAEDMKDAGEGGQGEERVYASTTPSRRARATAPSTRHPDSHLGENHRSIFHDPSQPYPLTTDFPILDGPTPVCALGD